MDDLIGEFISETAENLALLDTQLVQLERNPQDQAILGHIFRLVHTIKGTCGFLGLPRLESIAHAGETLLSTIRDKKLAATPEAVTLILQALDVIKKLIAHLDDKGEEAEGDDELLIARLNHFAQTGKEPAINADAAFPHFRGDDDAPAAPPVAQQSLRVHIDVLENLMQTVGELVLTRNQLMQVARIKEDSAFAMPLQQLSHITTELQESVMKTRMQPISGAWAKFPRLIRDISLELDKKIQLRMLGAETELDRQLLDVIKDPLIHMVRNSCDHGLESSAERLAAGKPETGTVTLAASHQGGYIVIDVSDDGRGIDIARVKRKAVAQGLLTQAAADAMGDGHIAEFIFHPGFSTAETITSLSGRGVGMDVVKTNIESIGGSIGLDSSWGKGAKISVRIPLTLAIVSVLLVEAGGYKFAIPQSHVNELVRVGPKAPLGVETINGALVLRLREKLLPVAALATMLGLPFDVERGMTVAVCRMGEYEFGIVIDHVYDTEEIVIKPVAGVLKKIALYSGTAILGDGSIVMILDPAAMARGAGYRDGMASPRPQALAQDEDSSTPQKRFLLFSTGKGALKSVPLELVTRLEEIDIRAIEVAGDRPVVQYHGDLMRLQAVESDFIMPDKGKLDVIVFNDDSNITGLVVKKIIDIVYAPDAVRLTPEKGGMPGYGGSIVIGGRTTDIIDVGYYLQEAGR